MENKQYRAFNGTILQDSSQSRLVSGYAVRFNEPSQNMGFIETISPTAITQDVINSSDIYAKMNHRDDVILARSRYGEGSLHLELREDGLFYSFEAPNTAFGDELLEHIKRGEISTSSFAFTVSESPKSERWFKEEGILKRTINKIDRLFDVSPTFEGAYLTTSCYSRDKGKAMEELAAKVEKKMDYYTQEIEKL